MASDGIIGVTSYAQNPAARGQYDSNVRPDHPMAPMTAIRSMSISG